MTLISSRTGVFLCVVACLLAAILAGCGGGGGGGGAASSGLPTLSSSTGGGSTATLPGEPTADVVVNLQLATQTPVPLSVTQLRLTIFSASGAILYGPRTLPKAPAITLTGVPIEAATLEIDYLTNGVVSGIASSGLSLSSGGTQTINDPTMQDVATALKSIQVTPPSALVAFGTSTQLTATGTFSDGSTRDMTRLVSWTSSQPASASVSTSGVVTALASGSASIQASFGSVAGSSSVAVSGVTLVSLQVTPATSTLSLGTTQQYTAIGTFSDTTTQDLTRVVTWSTSSSSVAQITTQGLASATGVGSCTVSASLNGVVGSASLTVSAATLVSLQITPPSVSLAKGLTRRLTATGTYSDSSTHDVSDQVTWTTSAAGIVTVDSTGLATAISVGTTLVSASLDGVSAMPMATVTVTPAVVQSIQVTPADPSLAVGLSRQMTATATFSDGTTQNVTTQVSWTTSSTADATVTSGGLVTAVAIGSPTITATLGGVQGSTTVTVIAPVLTSVQINPPSAAIPANTTVQLSATGIYSDKTTQDVTGQVSWSTFPATVATVSTNGLVTGVTAGSTVVTATLASVGSGFATITVNPVTLQSIQITPANASIPNGTSQPLAATGTFSDNSTRDLSALVSWSTSPTGLATVNGAGLATGVGVGTTIVTASLNGVSATTALTVKNVILQSIQVTAAQGSIASGTSTQLTAIGTFSDGSTRDLTGQVSWSATPLGSLAVSTSGLATGLSQGSATATASLYGVHGSTGVTVTPAVLTALQVGPPIPTLVAGTTLQLSATGTFSDGSTQDLTRQVSWSSGQSTIATVSTGGLASGVGAGSTMITAVATGGIRASVTLAVNAVTLQSLQITPASPSVHAGTTVQLTATGTYNDNSTRDLTSQVSWTTGAGGTATVVGGLVTGVAQGSADITATLGSVHATTTVTVTGATLQSIQVAPANPSLAKGTTRPLTATGTYSDNTTQDLSTQVSWTSSNTGDVTVSTAGLATAVAAGTATIKATLGAVQGSTSVTVTAATLQSLQVTASPTSVANGTTAQLTAIGTFSDSTTQDLSSQVSWTTAPTSGASVSRSGLLTATAEGIVTVTATDGSVSNNVNITVTAAILKSLQVTAAASAIANGTTTQLTALGTYTDNHTQDLTSQVSWTTSPTGVATVSSSGLATGTSVGSTTITATSGSVSGSTAVSVTAATLQSIQVTPAIHTVAKGATYQLTATGVYSDGSTQNLTSAVSWALTPLGYATVSTTGLVTGVAPSSGAVTAYATLNGKTGSGTFTVTTATLTGIQVTPTDPSLSSGTTRQLTATGIFSDGTTADLTSNPSLSWASSSTSVATVSGSGLARGVSAGSAAVTATVGAVSGSTTVTVSAATLTSIQVTAASPFIAKGTTTQMTAIGTFNNGSTQDLTSQVSWTTSPTGFVTVSSAGVATGKAVTGSPVTVTATMGSVSGSTTVQVTAAVLQSIQITPATPSVAKGSTVQLTATGKYSDNSTQDLSSQVSWSSSNTGQATVDSSGLTTGVAPGSPSITASKDGVNANITLTVTSASLLSIAVTPTNPSSTIAAGTTLQLTATGTYSDSTTQDLTSQASWTSSNTSVGTVSASGLVTSAQRGVTTVSATFNSVTGSSVISVSGATLQSVTVSPSSASLPVGATQSLKATGTYSDGTTQDLSSLASWTTSPTGIAAVDTSGTAAGLAVGSTTVTATYTVPSSSPAQTFTSSASLTVTEAALSRLTVRPASATIAASTSVQLSATGIYTDGSSRDLTGQVSWTASSGSATVTSSGLASGVSAGSVTVTATSGSVAGTANLTVTSATLSSIAVTGASSHMAQGTSVQFTAVGTFSDSSTQNLSTQVSWTSSDTGIAAVSGTGLATRAGSTGTVTISATMGGKNGMASLDVTSATISSVAVTPGNPTVSGNGTLQLTATGTFSDSTTQDLTTQATWSSSDTSKAAVSSTGLVTGVAGGSTTVSASLGGQSGSTAVTVTSPPGASWTGRSSPTSDQLTAVAFGGGKFVSVGFPDSTSGAHATLITSSDASSWSSVDPGTTNPLYGTAYGNGVYLAVGEDGTILSSTDAATWTSRTSGTSNAINAAVYGGTTWVAVGKSGTILTSSDAVTWTAQTSGTTDDLQGIVYASGTFVAVGNSGTILTSGNGTSWTSQSSGTSDNLKGVAFGNSTFVAVGASGIILSSSDAASWTEQISGVPAFLSGLTYADGVFLAAGDGGVVLTSPDGQTWKSRNSGTTNLLSGVTFGSGSFVAVGSSGTIITSP